MIKEDRFLEKIADFCISKSKDLGSTSSNVLVMNTISENVNIRNKKLDGSERSENLGVTLTTYIGKKKASISSTNLSENNLIELVTRCIEATKVTPEDEYNSLPDQELHFKGEKNLELYDNRHLSNDEKINFIKEAEEVAFSHDKIVNTNGSGFSETKSNFILANSNGFSDGYKTSQFTAYCEVVSKSNGSMERDYEYSSKRHYKDLLTPKQIGESAAKLAISKLNPKKIEKANIKKANGSRYFDSEGVRIEDLKLVKNGILKDYLVETYSGKKINRKSNGRSSGTTNLYFENGDQSFDQLINSEKKLLYIKETIGRGANIITGDYSVGASGIMIENGKFTFPVSEITIAGNFNEMFKNIFLADDLEFKYSTNSPTMLVNDITVGGK